MTYYIGLVDQSEDRAYGVWFPDLPGCTAMADSMDDLFISGAEAVRVWIEDATLDGEARPTPRLVSDLLSDAEVKKALESDKASFIQVPLLLDQGRSIRANISVDAGLLGAIDAAARQRGVTRSAFLAGAARDKIARGA